MTDISTEPRISDRDAIDEPLSMLARIADLLEANAPERATPLRGAPRRAVSRNASGKGARK